MPAPDLLHEWLWQTAAATPSAIALIEEDRVTSFAELFHAASEQAAQFARMGLTPGDRVALIAPKTTEAVVAVFATMLAGGVYVPIHPKWPADRAEAAVEDSGAKIVMEAGGRCRAIPRPSGQAAPAGAAVIFFTSGSTGQPKGVLLSHTAMAAFVRWSAGEFRIGASDRIACPAPLGFDLSTLDIFNMALTGAACVLVPEHIAWRPRYVVRYAAEHRVTVWYSVPSLLRMMLDEGLNRETAATLRTVLFAGEVCPAAVAAGLRFAMPHAVCANLYGPTETNVVTSYRLPNEADGATPPPIGRSCPYAVTRIDESTGELLAGGESLMTGYWNRPDETARALVAVEGRTFYHTGDRVHIDEAGEMRFLGRLDRQVKRRGYRIELGEIEAALARHPRLAESAVVATAAGARITAFVRALGEIPAAEVKAHCARTLPPYMTPDHVRFAAELPRGERGKIDYSALERLAEEN